MFELNKPSKDSDVYAAQLEHLGWKGLASFLTGDEKEAPDVVPGSTADVPDMDAADGVDQDAFSGDDGRIQRA